MEVLKSVQPTVRFDEPLGKDHFAVEYLLDKPLLDALQGSTAQGKVACHSSAEDKGKDRLLGKGKLISLLWVWKGHMVSIKIEMDWVLLNTNDGLEKLGLGQKPKKVRRKKGGRHRLSSVNRGPNGNPNPLLFWVLRRCLGYCRAWILAHLSLVMSCRRHCLWWILFRQLFLVTFGLLDCHRLCQRELMSL